MNDFTPAPWPNEAESQRLRESFARLIPRSDLLCERLYALLFDQHPSVSQLFPTEMQEQRDKVILLLATALDLLSDHDAFTEACQDCGRRHRAYGAERAHFPVVGELLITEMANLAEPKLTKSEHAAWRILVNKVTAEMISGFDGTAPTPSQG